MQCSYPHAVEPTPPSAQCAYRSPTVQTTQWGWINQLGHHVFTVSGTQCDVWACETHGRSVGDTWYCGVHAEAHDAYRL